MLFALLADAAEHPATWIAVGSAAVTTLGTIGLALIAWLGSKDRERLRTVEEKNKECDEKHERCEEERKKDKAELKARDEKDRRELEAKIADKQKQIDELKKQK